MGDEERVGLETLGRGAAVELFDDALKRVFENILDPNTEATAKRSVVLKVEFKPTEERDVARTVMEVKADLANAKGVGTFVFIGRRAGEAIATERNPKQMELPMSEIGGQQ